MCPFCNKVLYFRTFTDHSSSPRPPLPLLLILSYCSEKQKQVTGKFYKQKQSAVHVGWNLQKPTKQGRNDTKILSHHPYVYLETFKGENLREFRSLVAIHESLGGMASFGAAQASNPRKFFSQKSFFTNSRKFSRSKVSRYMVSCAILPTTHTTQLSTCTLAY